LKMKATSDGLYEYEVISQKTEFFRTKAVRTSDPT
jgi:hypothetical protein